MPPKYIGSCGHCHKPIMSYQAYFLYPRLIHKSCYTPSQLVDAVLRMNSGYMPPKYVGRCSHCRKPIMSYQAYFLYPRLIHKSCYTPSQLDAVLRMNSGGKGNLDSALHDLRRRNRDHNKGNGTEDERDNLPF